METCKSFLYFIKKTTKTLKLQNIVNFQLPCKSLNYLNYHLKLQNLVKYFCAFIKNLNLKDTETYNLFTSSKS